MGVGVGEGVGGGVGVGVGVGGSGSVSLHALTAACPGPPTVIVRRPDAVDRLAVRDERAIAGDGAGPGMGRPAESVPGLVPGVSQASPMPSPTSSPAAFLSLSAWSGLACRGQLSPLFGKPSPSWSVGWLARRAVLSVRSGSGHRCRGCRQARPCRRTCRCRPPAGTALIAGVPNRVGVEWAGVEGVLVAVAVGVALAEAQKVFLISVPGRGQRAQGMPPSLAGVSGLSFVTPYDTLTVLRGVQKSVIGARGGRSR